MHLLSIENGVGFLHLSDGTKKEMPEIDPVDIESSMAAILAEDCSIDPVAEIYNPAAKIIYTQLYKAFDELIDSKGAILAELDSTFEEAERKYLH